MLLKNCNYLDGSFNFRTGDIRIENGKISEISKSLVPYDGEGVKDAEFKKVIPGLIDVHIHGAVGHDANEDSPDGLIKVAKHLASVGVTSFLAGPGGLSDEGFLKAMSNIKAVSESEYIGAEILGIHSEGPYISPKKCGAMKPEFMRLPDAEHFKMLNDASGGRIKVITIAPELMGAKEFITKVSSDTLVSIGHTAATYDEAKNSIEWGIGRVTHLYNAMPGFSHRDPSVIGAVSDSDVMVELISDGIHIHPAVIRNTVRYVGYDRIMLISDAVNPMGLPNGTYVEPGPSGKTRIVNNGKITLLNGILAGSGTDLMEDVRRFHKMGHPLEKAVMCASRNPAKNLGISHERGSLEKGKIADIVILNGDLSVDSVYINGKEYKE